MFPRPGFMTVNWIYERFRLLESELSLVWELLAEVIERGSIDSSNGASNDRLARIRELASAKAIDGLTSQIAALIKAGDDSSLTQKLRDVTQLTWDEVFVLRKDWSKLDEKQRRSWVLRGQVRRALRGK